MMSNLIGIEPDPKAIRCDMPVEVVFEKLTDEITLPLFQPAGGGAMATWSGSGSCATRSASWAWTRATRSARCPNKSQLTLHLEAITQRGARRRPQGQRRRRHLHRGPALARPRSARRSASCRATSTAPRWAAARSSSWSATRWSRCTTGSATWRSSPTASRGRSGVGVTRGRDTALPRPVRVRPTASAARRTYFGMITTRHMHEYGTTLEQWAQVAVSTRKWAALNPKARNREPITVADVLNSRPVVLPVQPAQHLPRHRRGRRGGADARRPGEGLRQEAGLRARRRRGAPST